MRFGNLQLGDVFEAFGETFFKQPTTTTEELPDANAVNINTGKAAFFGQTVPVELVIPDALEVHDTQLRNRQAR